MTTGKAAALALCLAPLAPGGEGRAAEAKGTAAERLEGFQVVELRRYTIKAGARDAFARRFESWFPEAFQQLGALALGQFAVRGDPTGFTWLRGFRDMEARAIVNSAFYYGPVWKEHRSWMNEVLTDSDDVLLLRPLSPERGVLVLPAVDPVDEPQGAQGIVVAQIFQVQEKRAEELARQAEPAFAGYRAAGAREAGVLVTLDLPNNFPQLPVRTDGPYLVWLGLVKDDETCRRLQGLAEAASRSLVAAGLLRRAPELLLLEPTSRSRLRWPRERTG